MSFNLRILQNFIFLISAQILFSQSITLTAPNGGERIDSCSPYTISWQSSGTSDYYNIYYSSDNGVNWVSIASSLSTLQKTFSWDVPNLSTVNGLVKVTDAQDESINDVSDSVFIIDGSLILLYPSGNENFIAGQEIDIFYSYNQQQVQNIKIEYSVDDGESWITEILSTPADGDYKWTVPNLPNSGQTKIRLVDTQDPSCKIFENEVNFSITSSVTVLNPNGGESFKARVAQQGTVVIMNNGPSTVNTANFYDNGGYYNNYTSQGFIKTVKPDFPTNKLSVKFNSYNFESGDNLKVYDGDSVDSNLLGTLSNSSNNSVVFTATNLKGELTFKFETDNDNSNGRGWDAEITSIGTPLRTVSWSVTGTSKYFNLDYSINSGANWIRILSNYYSENGTYNWQVPNTPTENARFRVTDANNNEILDSSDSDFTIVEADPFIVLFEPSGGEVFDPGDIFNIEWGVLFLILILS